jgi:NAD(P)-dependent dehydrogenase (short-subunit alcohol dehydrogenase family)
MLLNKIIQKKINQDFKGKHYILTGYSSGIGNRIHKDLSKLGSKVILLGRHIVKSPLFFNCDLRDVNSLEETVKKISKKYSRIDGFIHCAGLNQCIKIEKIKISDWENILSVNLTSAFIISKEIKKNLIKSKNPSIVFVSSIAGHRKSVVSGVHYVTSKAGLIGMSKQLAYEFGKDKIRINCISPSQTISKMLKKSMNKYQINNLIKNIPLGRLATAEDQSHGVIFLLSSFSKYISGTSMNIDGGQI